jgi:hypothetical protein
MQFEARDAIEGGGHMACAAGSGSTSTQISYWTEFFRLAKTYRNWDAHPVPASVRGGSIHRQAANKRISAYWMG